MFYYGLYFHDLAPDSNLHISSIIVVCEAFLHITPHFGLWLKKFNVKPKVIEGRHAECGGAGIRRNADVPWPEGSFPEVVLRHSSPRHNVGGCPCLPFGSSTSTASWTNVGLDWGPANDVPTLQSRIRDLLERDIDLVRIIQVMLVRRILPCKRRPLRKWEWEFNPEGPRTIQHFFDVTLEGMYKLFFGPQIRCPDTTEDAGLSCLRPDTQVSNSITEHFAYA